MADKKQQGKTDVADQPTSAPAVDPALTQGVTSVATTEKKTTALAVAPQQEETGFEHMTQADFKVPFVNVLQAKSPQAEEGNPKQIAGAKAGTLINSVTQQMFDGKTGIVVIPVHSIHQFLEWIPRDDGGGLVNVFDWQAPEVLAAKKAAGGKKFGKIKIGDNNDLVESFNVFALLEFEDQRVPIVLPFSSSQIAPYQMWMTSAKSQTKMGEDNVRRPRALWSHRYRITTSFQQNKKGTWFKMAVSFEGGDAEKARIAEDDPITQEAKDFRSLLLSGAVQANFDSAQRDEAETVEASYEM